MHFGGFANRWQESAENIIHNHDFYLGRVICAKMFRLYGPRLIQAHGRQCIKCVVFDKLYRVLVS
jgi:hypothetical protein